jgi:hypothetical protein
MYLPTCEKAILVSAGSTLIMATMVAVDVDKRMGTQQQEVLLHTNSTETRNPKHIVGSSHPRLPGPFSW